MISKEKKYEVDNLTGINHEGTLANHPVQRLTATSIIGDSVENNEGENLGQIDNLMVNVHTGLVEYAVVEFGSFLGLGGKLFAIPFKELRVNPAKKVFVFTRDKDYLKKSPGFDKTHWPDTNDHYYDYVDNYYGTEFPPPMP
ncbi:MAG TPA: PRC-barrel domain-containing protein [Chryseolinea sp.]|nr:PRC-barrel domain-containing protein [Chryseolinea sp.]